MARSTAILKGAVYLPLPRPDSSAIRSALTVDVYEPGEESPTVVHGYADIGTHLVVPRYFGIEYAERTRTALDDRRSEGLPISFPTAPVPREKQVPILQEMKDLLAHSTDVTLKAHVGFGKTVCGILLAQHLGRTTLIVVDQENLKRQWIETLTDMFGVPLSDIGVIQGKKCEYEGKSVVIAMVQTLSQCVLPDEVYDYFGLMILDECHIFGAAQYSRVMLEFHAKYRIPVSATPDRKDALQRILKWNLGKDRVSAAATPDKSAVFIVEHETVYSWYATVSPKQGRIITEIAEDPSRNLLIAQIAKLVYDDGHHLLIQSDRIEQLQELRAMLYYLGVPEEDLGLFTAFSPEMKLRKDAEPKGLPPHVAKDDEGNLAPFSPLHYEAYMRKVKTKEFIHMEKNCRILLATAAKFSKGANVPRLSAGIDATPKAAAEQSQGRILRPLEGKLTPLWITISDVNNYRCQHWYASRLRDYARNNVVFNMWNEDGSTTPCNVRDLIAQAQARSSELRDYEIRQQPNGWNELLPTTGSPRKRQRGLGIVDVRA